AAAGVAVKCTGLSWKASLGVGLGLAHMGEFSFVLTLEAMSTGLISQEVYARVLAVAVASLALTPPLLRLGSRLVGDEEEQTADENAVPVAAKKSAGATGETTFDHASQNFRGAVVVGLGVVGRQLASRLETDGWRVCTLDMSPVNLHPFAQQGFRTVAGDATDVDVLRRAYADVARLVVVTVPDDSAAVAIVAKVRTMNRIGRILVRCRYQASSQPLTRAGATRIVSEEVEASAALIKMLEEEQMPTEVPTWSSRASF
ncbi:MAG: NAD-binding protein, partial [Planctomycetia bacterium]